MRIAVLYDFLEVIGGGERVALFLGEHLRAPVFTTNFDPALPARAGFAGVEVRSLGAVPRQSPLRHIGATVRFMRAQLTAFDRIVCVGNFSVYTAANHPAHLWYCLTPTRLFFDQRAAMLRRLPMVSRAAAAAWSRLHGRWEQRAVRQVKRILALSETSRARIRRYYGRDVPVLYPPVPTSRYRFREVGDFWLSANRLYPEKRIELQLETFRRLPSERLVIVGGASADAVHRSYVRSLQPPPNVEFLNEVPDDRLVDLFARCRGLVATAVDEDFGLTPVEAMAAGKCVLATNEGGYRETIVDGETGFLLPPRADAFADRIRSLDDTTLRAMRPRCESRAKEFDESVFLARIKEEIGWRN